MERYQEVMSLFQNRHEKVSAAPPGGGLAMISYPVGFAMKPHYLENHTSQIKSYYISLSGSYGRSFRICPEKLRAAPTDGEITMTSYPVGN